MAAAMGIGSPKMTYQTCADGRPSQHRFAHRLPSLACSVMFKKQSSQRTNRKACRSLEAVSPLQCTKIPMQLLLSFEDFCVSVSTEEDRAIKIQVNVAGTMTDSTFEKVFKKNVAAAQPLPGFRRMKGGLLL
ncbi:hypothetical protein QOZ80_6AG0529960 [Eleusine coracana subsp. coracana]|nr:hypothetical protein QOZ80_6AG0529960 [Eleusine coracana subsp. coracana]